MPENAQKIALKYLYDSLEGAGFSKPYAVCDAVEALEAVGVMNVRLTNDAVIGGQAISGPRIRINIEGTEPDSRYFP